MSRFRARSVYGVDFSGAKLAGRNIWIARAEPAGSQLRLTHLDRLETLCGSPDREPALAHLVERIRESTDAIWGIDFPFALPIEIVDPGVTFRQQLEAVGQWNEDAAAFGRNCVQRAQRLGGKMHVRRCTDTETRTPFDCYHYRIIYQTFHGMRDVLTALAADASTTIAPFEPLTRRTRRVVVEACPASTLKHLRLPHQNYKQPAGGALTPLRRHTRRQILSALSEGIDIPAQHLRRAMRNPGGDALDAIIAALGTWRAWHEADHNSIAAHPRYSLEGRVYA